MDPNSPVVRWTAFGIGAISSLTLVKLWSNRNTAKFKTLMYNKAVHIEHARAAARDLQQATNDQMAEKIVHARFWEQVVAEDFD